MEKSERPRVAYVVTASAGTSGAASISTLLVRASSQYFITDGFPPNTDLRYFARALFSVDAPISIPPDSRTEIIVRHVFTNMNLTLVHVSLVAEMRKPFDVLVKGLLVPSSRGDKI